MDRIRSLNKHNLGVHVVSLQRPTSGWLESFAEVSLSAENVLPLAKGCLLPSDDGVGGQRLSDKGFALKSASGETCQAALGGDGWGCSLSGMDPLGESLSMATAAVVVGNVPG